ncbi:MAG TPA: DNA polymerase IV [Armatimonadota bacterium]|jgi:DNA polymerase-4
MAFSTGFRASLARGAQAQASAAFSSEAVGERVIFLLDYDSFFARCMQQAYPPLRGKPVGIRGPAKGTAIIAASTEAKQYGIKVGVHLNEARRLCPGLIPVHADMDMYAEICTRSLRVLTSYTDQVEPFSIDEAFMDVTDLIERFGGARLLAQQIKRDLRDALGAYITCSIGVAPNKMLAKLASHFDKPDGVTVVHADDIPALLDKITLTDICGIGARVERRLQRLGVYTVAQLGKIPRAVLVKEFGVLGHVYALWGQGIDLTPVQPYHQQAEEKSIGHGLTLPDAVGDRRTLDGIILRLCERVGRRLRRRNFLGKTVQCWVRHDGFDHPGGFGGRRTLDHYTDNSALLYRVVQGMFPGPGLACPVRQVHVTVSQLRHNALQLSLEEDRVQQRQLQQTLDTVNDKFGEFTIMLGTLLFDTFPLRNGPPGHAFCKRYSVDAGTPP